MAWRSFPGAPVRMTTTHPNELLHTNLNDQEIDDRYRTIMRAGSKSFSFAARFFDQETYAAVIRLYTWCRFCDDWIDRFSSQTNSSEKSLLEAVDQLMQWTELAFRSNSHLPLPFQALRNVATKYNIPIEYPRELILGMRFDAMGSQVISIEDLDLYCYRVAGVVGLMMCSITGVTRDSALQSAIDTGLAMQMTNISRDIREDFELGRIYIPTAWFSACNLQRPSLNEPFNPRAFVGPVRILLAQADRRYRSGRKGLDALPLLASFAVGSAQTIYRDIGTRVLAQGKAAWDQRVYVSRPRKALLTLRYLCNDMPRILLQVPRRRKILHSLPLIRSEDLKFHSTSMES